MLSVVDDVDIAKFRRNIFLLGIISFVVSLADLRVEFSSIFGILKAEVPVTIENTALLFILVSAVAYFTMRWAFQLFVQRKNERGELDERLQKAANIALSLSSVSATIDSLGESREQLERILLIIKDLERAAAEIEKAVINISGLGVSIIPATIPNHSENPNLPEPDEEKRIGILQSQLAMIQTAFSEWWKREHEITIILENFNNDIYIEEIKQTLNRAKNSTITRNVENVDRYWLAAIPPVVGLLAMLASIFVWKMKYP